jgi:hypothetical protein
MTTGETLFYLREIQTHWLPSNLSSEKLAELQAAGLIERAASASPTFRLTSEGVRCKTAGRRPPALTGVTLTGMVRSVRRHPPRKAAPPLKGLV